MLENDEKPQAASEKFHPLDVTGEGASFSFNVADFFDRIDTSKPVLLLGDSKHDFGDGSPRDIQDFVVSPEFIQAAIDFGYTRFLIELPPHTDADELQRLYPHNSGMGLPVVPVDPRSDALHQEIRYLHENLKRMGDKLTAGSGDKPINPKIIDILRREYDNVIAMALSEDPALLKTIMSEAENNKIIVFYGSSHFAKGSSLETGIPQAMRSLSILEDDDPLAKRHDYSSDAICYQVTRDSTLSTPSPERATPSIPPSSSAAVTPAATHIRQLRDRLMDARWSGADQNTIRGIQQELDAARAAADGQISQTDLSSHFDANAIGAVAVVSIESEPASAISSKLKEAPVLEIS